MAPPMMAALGIFAGVFAAQGAEAAVRVLPRVVALLDAPANASCRKPRVFSAAGLEPTPAVAPHFVQNFVAVAKAAPHLVQKRPAGTGAVCSLRGAPHFVQNQLPSISAAPHCLQFKLITRFRPPTSARKHQYRVPEMSVLSR